MFQTVYEEFKIVHKTDKFRFRFSMLYSTLYPTLGIVLLEKYIDIDISAGSLFPFLLGTGPIIGNVGEL